MKAKAEVITKKWVKEQLLEMEERFAQLLVKHFYTKDEIDRKLTHFATKEELRQTEERLKSFIGTQVETLRDDFRAAFDGIKLHTEKLNNHEIRITKLESTIVSQR